MRKHPSRVTKGYLVGLYHIYLVSIVLKFNQSICNLSWSMSITLIVILFLLREVVYSEYLFSPISFLILPQMNFCFGGIVSRL